MCDQVVLIRSCRTICTWRLLKRIRVCLGVKYFQTKVLKWHDILVVFFTKVLEYQSLEYRKLFGDSIFNRVLFKTENNIHLFSEATKLSMNILQSNS
jgi:hypothetical protein